MSLIYSHEMELNRIYNENCLSTMGRMPDGFVDCVVTSPPYWGLRDYGHNDQIGLEKTPEEYVNKMVEVFREVRRVLKPSGTVWLNLGDSYNGSGGWGGNDMPSAIAGSKQTTNKGSHKQIGSNVQSLKPKDLIGIPWRVAFALQADGWWLRQDIIWAKPNPMPESVKDRCTKAHEYIFLLTKSAKYSFDWEAIAEAAVYCGITGMDSTGFKDPHSFNGKHRNLVEKGQRIHSMHKKRAKGEGEPNTKGKRNKRSVWEIATEPFPEAHFATFPTKLPSLCILAGCPEGGIVYDPFMGAGTTALAAIKYGRPFIGSEISAEYCQIAEKRIKPHLQQKTLF
jgi:DNA modification methylase